MGSFGSSFPAKGKYEEMLRNGLALADDGQTYPSVQSAVDSASDYVLIGPGTFEEAVSITTAGLTVEGVGRGSFIDGGVEIALEVDANNVTLRDFSIQSDTGSGSDAISVGANAAVENCTVESVVVTDAGAGGISVNNNSAETTLRGIIVEASDLNAIYDFAGTRTKIEGCTTQSGVGNNGIFSQIGSNTIITGNHVTDATGFGIRVGADNAVVGSNRVNGVGADGISVEGPNQVICNNVVSGFSGGNVGINTSSATDPVLDSNITF